MATTSRSPLLFVSIMLLSILGETNAAFAFGIIGKKPRASVVSSNKSPRPPPLLPLHHGDGTTTTTMRYPLLNAKDSFRMSSPLRFIYCAPIKNSRLDNSDGKKFPRKGSTVKMATFTTSKAILKGISRGGSTKMTTSTREAVNGDEDNNQVVTGWRAQLLQASNIASLLCVLDCTVLPVVTVVLPFFGLVAASPAQMEFLHQLGHSVALWFVLPVGGSATLLNYLYAHKQKRIAALGSLGLLMVLAANAPQDLLHWLEHGVLAFLYPLLHAVHHGITHRLVNILGCACLLTSNYLSKQSGKCLHGHDRSECSDHSGRSHSHDH